MSTVEAVAGVPRAIHGESPLAAADGVSLLWTDVNNANTMGMVRRATSCRAAFSALFAHSVTLTHLL